MTQNCDGQDQATGHTGKGSEVTTAANSSQPKLGARDAGGQNALTLNDAAIDRLLAGAKTIIEEQEAARIKSQSFWTLGNVATAIALVFSVSTACWTLYEKFISVGVPTLISPTITNFFCSEEEVSPNVWRCNANNEVLKIRVGQFDFRNESIASNSYLITDAWVTARFLGDGSIVRDPIRLRWQSFSDATDSGNPRTSAKTIEVSTTRRESREIEFTWRRENATNGSANSSNRLSYYDFEALIAEGKVDEILLEFEFEVDKQSNPITTQCRIPIGSDFVTSAGLQKFALFSRDCDAG